MHNFTCFFLSCRFSFSCLYSQITLIAIYTSLIIPKYYAGVSALLQEIISTISFVTKNITTCNTSVHKTFLKIRKFILMRNHINIRNVEKPWFMAQVLPNTHMFMLEGNVGSPTSVAHILFNISKFTLVGNLMNVNDTGRLLFGLCILLNMRKFMRGNSYKECRQTFFIAQILTSGNSYWWEKLWMQGMWTDLSLWLRT